MVTRTTLLTLGQCAASLLFVIGVAGQGQAQSFTIGGASSQTSQPGADFATTVLGDPWDLEEDTDWVRMYTDNGSGAPMFSGTPTQASGVLRGVSAGNAPSIQMLYQGIDGALNSVGRSGVLTPIDTSRYRRLSFRARRSVGTPDVADRVAAFWFPQSSMAGSGFALWQARGTLPGSQHANMMPQAAQSAPPTDLPRRHGPTPAELGRRVDRPGARSEGAPRLVEHGDQRHARSRLGAADRARQHRRRSAVRSSDSRKEAATMRRPANRSSARVRICRRSPGISTW